MRKAIEERGIDALHTIRRRTESESKRRKKKKLGRAWQDKEVRGEGKKSAQPERRGPNRTVSRLVGATY